MTKEEKKRIKEKKRQYKNNKVKEKKKISKKKVILIIVIIAIVAVILRGLLYFVTPREIDIDESTVFDEETIESVSEEIMTLMGEEDFETIYEDYFSDDLKDSLSEDDIEAAYDYFDDNWGEYLAYGKTDIDANIVYGKSYASIEAMVTYDNLIVTFTLSYNTDMELTSFYIE